MAKVSTLWSRFILWQMRIRRLTSYWATLEQIKKSGKASPVIVILPSRLVLDGNRRVTAAREAGKLVPVVFIQGQVEMVDPELLNLTFGVDIAKIASD